MLTWITGFEVRPSLTEENRLQQLWNGLDVELPASSNGVNMKIEPDQGRVGMKYLNLAIKISSLTSTQI